MINQQQLLELRQYIIELRRHAIATQKAAEKILDLLDDPVVQLNRPAFHVGPTEKKSQLPQK